VALEVSRNLQVSEQHRQRAESLTNLALEVNSLLRGPEFARKFVERAAGMMEAPHAALIVDGGKETSIVTLRGAAENRELDTRLVRAALAALNASSARIVHVTAEALVGAELAQQAGWKDLVLTRLSGSAGELLGALCL